MKTQFCTKSGVDNHLGWGNVVYMPERIMMADDHLVRFWGVFGGASH